MTLLALFCLCCWWAWLSGKGVSQQALCFTILPLMILTYIGG